MRRDVDRFLRVLEAERGFSHNTVVAYRNDLYQFVGFLANGAGSEHDMADVGDCAPTLPEWANLTDGHLNDYLRLLHERSYATSTVARKTAAIKSFFQYLHREGLMGEDPSARMSPPRVDKYTPRAISASEVHRLLEQPCGRRGERATRPEALRDRAMLETLYATGMRVSELVALDVGDVELDSGCVRCGSTAVRERQLPLRESAVNSLGCYLSDARPILECRDTDALFLNHRGRRLTRQGFWLILKSYAHQAQIEGVTPHTLRHTFATHAIREGTELRLVQHLLGHVSISTTQVYRRLADAVGSEGEGIATRSVEQDSVPR